MDKDDTPAKRDLNNAEKVLNESKNIAPVVRRKCKPKTPQQQEKLSRTIANVLSEYVDCFVLLAFDNAGNPVAIVNKNNNLETRALQDFLLEFVEHDIIMNMDIQSERDDMW